MESSPDRISHQAVGAFGERAVEAELLRNGWIPANINATVKNAAEFDISAWKAARQILVRVKTCSARMKAFQWGGFKPGLKIDFASLRNTDYTVLVQMGVTRADDKFYVIPTRVIRRQLDTYRSHYLKIKKRDGAARKDTGHWTLHLDGAKTDQPQYGFAKKWAEYLGNWEILEGTK